MNIRSMALVTLSILCRCGRPVCMAEVDGERVLYRVPEVPTVPLMTLYDVVPSVHLGGSMADVTAGLAALREGEPKMTETGEWLLAGRPVSRTVTFQPHGRGGRGTRLDRRGNRPGCRARTSMRMDRLDALVLAAVTAGKTSVTLG
jgi:hypothetical protein